MITLEQLLKDVEQSYPSMTGFTKLLLEHFKPLPKPILLIKLSDVGSEERNKYISIQVQAFEESMNGEYHVVAVVTKCEGVQLELLSIANLDESNTMLLEDLKAKLLNQIDKPND